jgi:excisionase family DNA binding protein
VVAVTEPDVRPMYTPSTLATRLGISERQVYRLLDGEDPIIPSFKLGHRQRRIDPDVVEAYLATLTDKEGSDDAA